MSAYSVVSFSATVEILNRRRGRGERQLKTAQTIGPSCGMTNCPGKIEYNCRYFIMSFRTQIHKKKFCKKKWFSYSTGYYVPPPIDQFLKFKNHCSLLTNVHHKPAAGCSLYYSTFFLLFILCCGPITWILRKLTNGHRKPAAGWSLLYSTCYLFYAGAPLCESYESWPMAITTCCWL